MLAAEHDVSSEALALRHSSVPRSSSITPLGNKGLKPYDLAEAANKPAIAENACFV